MDNGGGSPEDGEEVERRVALRLKGITVLGITSTEKTLGVVPKLPGLPDVSFVSCLDPLSC